MAGLFQQLMVGICITAVARAIIFVLGLDTRLADMMRHYLTPPNTEIFTLFLAGICGLVGVAAWNLYWERKPRKLRTSFKCDYTLFAAHEHATILWVNQKKAFYRLFSDGTWDVRPDPVWDIVGPNEAELRTRFSVPPEKFPPVGGIAYLWERNPDDWRKVGWMEWSAAYNGGKIKFEEYTDGSFVIGPFRPHPNADEPQTFTLNADKSWSSDRTASKAPMPDDVGGHARASGAA